MCKILQNPQKMGAELKKKHEKSWVVTGWGCDFLFCQRIFPIWLGDSPYADHSHYPCGTATVRFPTELEAS